MIEMLDDRVAIIPLKDPGYKGSIIIPDTVREDRRPDQGIVYQRGPNTVEVKRGQHVLFSPYAGTKLSLEDVGVVYIMPEEAILATLTKDEPDIILASSTVKRLMEVARQHYDKHPERSPMVPGPVDIYEEMLHAELDGYVASRGFEY